ncbi:MAG: type II toxin-antitoxin system Phd/YefM family antitoxin [Burkholderiales bacterium]
MTTRISASAARTRLAELLRQAMAGRRFTITHRGKAIAHLIPAECAAPKDKAAAVEKFNAFMRDNPIRGRADVRALVEEGRS